MRWYEMFAIWYIGCFSIVFGIAMILWGRWLGSARRVFHHELRNAQTGARLASVVRRRDELEGDLTSAWRLTGALAIVIGVLVLVRVVIPVVGYALLCAVLAVIMSQVYLSLRNRGARRAASLQPRTVTSTVPLLWYVGGIASAVLPLAMWTYPQSRAAAVIVCLATLAVVFFAYRTASMAALLAGEDPEVEVYVDTRLRWSRVAGQLALAYAVSYVFISMAGPSLTTGGPVMAVVNAISTVLLLSFAVWAIAMYFRGRSGMKTFTV